LLPAAGGEAVEDGDECVDIGAGIVECEGGPHAGFLTEATEDGLGAMMPGADGDAVGIEGGPYLFCLVAVEDKREDAGLVGRRANETQTGNVFEQPGSILQEIGSRWRRQDRWRRRYCRCRPRISSAPAGKSYVRR
jgi:hypothetical protein